MLLYQIRAILDVDDDVIRDITIDAAASLEELHHSLVQAFGFDGREMASFYTCDAQWEQEQEIPLFDTGDEPGVMPTMSNTHIGDVLADSGKLIYVYDFLSMWTFLLELQGEVQPLPDTQYPKVSHIHGEMPEVAPNKAFEADQQANNPYADFEDGYDEDDFEQDDDMFGGESFDEFGYEDNWN